MSEPKNYLLVIANAFYQSIDPSGRSDLPSTTHDAERWIEQCLAMGFSLSHMRVVATPTPAHLHHETLSVVPATSQHIKQALQWLTDVLQSSPQATALVVYSGHGMTENGHLMLCPSDLTSSFEQLVDVWELPYLQGKVDVLNRMTVVVDSCHAQVGSGLGWRERLREISRGAVEQPTHARVLAACDATQNSQSAPFSGNRELGALTWAATNVLSQWQMVQREHIVQSTLSYGEWKRRIDALLHALSFAQNAVLSGPAQTERLAIFQHGETYVHGSTYPFPTARRGRRQLDGGQYPGTFNRYHFSWKQGSTVHALAVVAATGGPQKEGASAPTLNNVPLESYTEYWLFNPEKLALLISEYSAGKSLRLSTEVAAVDETSHTTSSSFTARYAAAEGTKDDWLAYEPGVGQPLGLTFSADNSNSTQDVRALSIVVASDGTPQRVWWGKQTQQLISPADLAGKSFWSDLAPTFVAFYEPSDFT